MKEGSSHSQTCWEPISKIILISILSISIYVCKNVPFYLGPHPVLHLKLKGNPPSQRAIKLHENEEKLAGIMEFRAEKGLKRASSSIL